MNKTFNFYLSTVYKVLFPHHHLGILLRLLQVRIRSEHANGYLKGRFQALRGLQQRIDSAIDYQRAISMVQCMLIIHGLALEVEQLLDDGDMWEWAMDGAPEDNDIIDAENVFAPGDVIRIDRESDGALKRRQIHRLLFESLNL